MEQKVELKPCPWCGETPKVLRLNFTDSIEYGVACLNMSCSIKPCSGCFDTTEEEAIEHWNTRYERTGECICIKDGPMYDTYRYTCCGYEHAESVSEDYGVQNYCPNCGARLV